MKVVVGFGKTGWSCIDYLTQQGETVVAMDTRVDPPQIDEIRAAFPQVKFIVGGLSSEYLNQADEIIISPGLSLKTPEIATAIQKGIPCIGDIELFVRAATAPIIAITGSNGKTTLTTLMGEILKEAGYRAIVCGNIGAPALAHLDKTPVDYYVMELSSFQLETTQSLRARVAVLLNVTPDHMDRYDTLDDYAAAKLRIYEGCHTAVINADEPYTRSISAPQQIYFSTTQSDVDFYLGYDGDALSIYHRGQVCFPVTDLTCPGKHNYENVLAALSMGYDLGLTIESMHETLKHFQGLPHRCQKIISNRGVDWYNDSKATNIGATVAALNSLKPLYQEIVLIAGGDAKGADLSPLGPLAAATVSHVILLGAAASDLEKIMQGYVSTTRVKDLKEAVLVAERHAVSGGAVLLSPACASWDMFANYEERGNLFSSAVKERIDANGSVS